MPDSSFFRGENQNARGFAEHYFRFFIIPWEIETFFYFVERGFARRYLFYKTRHRISDLS